MREDKLLYQIKSLNKLIIRIIIGDDNKFPTPTQMEIVEYILKQQDGYVYQRDLESVLNLRRATVSGVLQTMEKNNLIKRVVDVNDSRVKKIILNKEALNTFNSHIKKIESIEKILTSDLTEEEIRIFLNIIKKMQENLKGGCKNV
jgi:DNA-binding MarR family transcriptional regulator